MSKKLILLIIIISCAVCSLTVGVLTYKITNGNWQTEYDTHIIEDGEKQNSYLLEIRKYELAISTAQGEIEENAKILETKYFNDIADANANSDRLREKIRQLSASRAAKNTGIDRDSAAAATDNLVYAKLFERAERTAVDLAGYADRARNAGLTCENKYKALYNKYSF